MKKQLLAGVVLIALAATLAIAQTGEDVVNRHLQAAGGAAKFTTINSIKSTGTFAMPAMGLEMKYTMMQKRGGKMIIRMSSDQFGNMIQASDGTTFWMINPFAGAVEPTEMPAEAATQFKRQTDIDGFFVNRDKTGVKLESMGQAELGGAKYNKVKVTYKSGFEQFAFFDIETGLLISMETTSEQMGQMMTVTSQLSDYREVNGRLVAHRIENSTSQGDMIITIDSVEYNVAIDDSEFVMPKAEK